MRRGGNKTPWHVEMMKLNFVESTRWHGAWSSLIQWRKCKLEVEELPHDLGHSAPPGLNERVQNRPLKFNIRLKIKTQL